jgi:hypothetical protein
LRRSNLHEHTGTKGMRQPGNALVIFALLLLGACASKPYLRTDYVSHQAGLVQVCYDPDSTTPKQAQQLAEDVCKRYDRMSLIYLTQENQCSWAAPTLATYMCAARPGEHPAPLVRQRAPLRIEPPGIGMPTMEQVAPQLSFPTRTPQQNRETPADSTGQ